MSTFEMLVKQNPPKEIFKELNLSGLVIPAWLLFETEVAVSIVWSMPQNVKYIQKLW